MRMGRPSVAASITIIHDPPPSQLHSFKLYYCLSPANERKLIVEFQSSAKQFKCAHAGCQRCATARCSNKLSESVK